MMSRDVLSASHASAMQSTDPTVLVVVIAEVGVNEFVQKAQTEALTVALAAGLINPVLLDLVPRSRAHRRLCDALTKWSSTFDIDQPQHAQAFDEWFSRWPMEVLSSWHVPALRHHLHTRHKPDSVKWSQLLSLVHSDALRRQTIFEWFQHVVEPPVCQDPKLIDCMVALRDHAPFVKAVAYALGEPGDTIAAVLNAEHAASLPLPWIPPSRIVLRAILEKLRSAPPSGGKIATRALHALRLPAAEVIATTQLPLQLALCAMSPYNEDAELLNHIFKESPVMFVKKIDLHALRHFAGICGNVLHQIPASKLLESAIENAWQLLCTSQPSEWRWIILAQSQVPFMTDPVVLWQLHALGLMVRRLSPDLSMCTAKQLLITPSCRIDDVLALRLLTASLQLPGVLDAVQTYTTDAFKQQYPELLWSSFLNCASGRFRATINLSEAVAGMIDVVGILPSWDETHVAAIGEVFCACRQSRCVCREADSRVSQRLLPWLEAHPSALPAVAVAWSRCGVHTLLPVAATSTVLQTVFHRGTFDTCTKQGTTLLHVLLPESSCFQAGVELFGSTLLRMRDKEGNTPAHALILNRLGLIATATWAECGNFPRDFDVLAMNGNAETCYDLMVNARQWRCKWMEDALLAYNCVAPPACYQPEYFTAHDIAAEDVQPKPCTRIVYDAESAIMLRAAGFANMSWHNEDLMHPTATFRSGVRRVPCVITQSAEDESFLRWMWM